MDLTTKGYHAPYYTYDVYLGTRERCVQLYGQGYTLDAAKHIVSNIGCTAWYKRRLVHP